MVRVRLCLAALLMLSTVLSSPGYAASCDVTIKINGGNYAFAGRINKLEIWIRNDVPIAGMVLTFRTDFNTPYRWIKPYGNRPVERRRVQELGDAAGAFDWSFWFDDKNDNTSPDTMRIVAIGFDRALPVHYGTTKLYDLAFYLAPLPDGVVGQMRVDNIAFADPYMNWEFSDDFGITIIVPTFQGNPNTDSLGVNAPPVGFMVYWASYTPGDANHNGIADIADVVYIIRYIFASGPTPDPYANGEVNGDLIIDISDAVYLVEWIFGGGPAPR
jgi:hypothetical protein